MSDPFNQQLAQRVEPNGSISPLQRRKQVAAEVANGAANLPIAIVQMLNQGLGQFWNGQTDPQKLADQLDADFGTGYTAKLFELHAKLGAFVAAESPALAAAIHKRPPDYNITINPDGSVTITETEE